jgi:hypothetical protein
VGRHVIIDLLSAVYRISLIFALRFLLLNIEYILMYVPKALAAVVLMGSLHVILLTKMTPRYLAVFTNGMFRPFSWSLCSRHSTSSRVDSLNLPYIDLYIPALIP